MARIVGIGKTLRAFLPKDELLAYLESTLRVYNRYGRRDNLYKSRIKILVASLGEEEYRRQVEEEFAHMKTLGLDPPIAELNRIRAHFADPAYEAGLSDDIDRSDPDFALWLDQNVAPHKRPGYAIATISLKPVGGKFARANAMVGAVEAGLWHLREGSTWADRMADEFAVFPNGAHDDRVDAASQLAAHYGGAASTLKLTL